MTFRGFCVAALLVGTTLSWVVSATARAGERTPTNSAPEPAQIPFRLIGPSAPLVNVRIQNRDILLELDIGDSSALVLHPSVLSSLSTGPTGESSKGYGMEGKVFNLPIVRVKQVEMGTAVFADVSTHADSHDDAFRKQQLTERGTQGYIGTGLFKGYKLVLNYRRHLLTLIPKDSCTFSQFHVDINGKTSGTISPLIPNSPSVALSPLFNAALSNAAAAGFTRTSGGAEYSTTLRGDRYTAGDVQPAKQYQLNKTYEIEVASEGYGYRSFAS